MKKVWLLSLWAAFNVLALSLILDLLNSPSTVKVVAALIMALCTVHGNVTLYKIRKHYVTKGEQKNA